MSKKLEFRIKLVECRSVQLQSTALGFDSVKDTRQIVKLKYFTTDISQHINSKTGPIYAVFSEIIDCERRYRCARPFYHTLLENYILKFECLMIKFVKHWRQLGRNCHRNKAMEVGKCHKLLA